jgi:hypothetical protein
MHAASHSPRGLAATALAGLALFLLPASASAQVETEPVGDKPQSMSIMGSGRPDVDTTVFRTRGDKPKVRVKRARRTRIRAAVFGRVGRTGPARLARLSH